MKVGKINFYLLLVAVIPFYAGCSGGSGSTSMVFSEVVSFNGKAIKGPLINGTVSAIMIDSDGYRAGTILTSRTDEYGNFGFETTVSGPALLVATGGSYVDEATRKTVFMADGVELTALIYIVPVSLETGVRTVVITPLTHLATGQALNSINGGTDPFSAINDANTNVADLLGLSGVDIATTIPFDFTREGVTVDPSSDEAKYGLIISSMSQQIADEGLEPEDLLDRLDALRDDLSDGTLDDQDSEAVVDGMADAADSFLDGDYNESGTLPGDISVDPGGNSTEPDPATGDGAGTGAGDGTGDGAGDGTGSVDDKPDTFDFSDIADAALNTYITSDTITVTGVDTVISVLTTCGTLVINGTETNKNSGNVTIDYEIAIQILTNQQNGITTECTVTIGSVSDLFTVTTISQLDENIETLLTTGACVSCNLDQAPLAGYDLTGVDLTSASLVSADISNAAISSAIFTKADMTSINLSSSNLTSADLSDTNLTSANLSGATVNWASFTKANLTYADFTDAYTFGTIFRDSTLTSSTITSAYATYLVTAIFEGATWVDGVTVCQAGSIGVCIAPDTANTN